MSNIVENVFKFSGEKKYNVEQELKNELESVLGKFSGMISVVSALGVVELLKADLIEQCNDE